MVWTARRTRPIVAVGCVAVIGAGGCLFPAVDDLVCEAGCGGSSSTGGGGSTGGGPCALRAGMRGTEGIHVAPPSAPAFCIEPTEVTVAQYYELYQAASFPLAPDPTPPECGADPQPPNAATNTRGWFAPGAATIAYYDEHTDERDRPIQSIHWCQAQAYCVWAGKHLCRAGDGDGPVDVSAPGWNRTTQWYHACRGAADLAYGYGDAYVPGTCNDSNGSADNNYETSPVDQPAGCTSAWPSGVIFDMSGNVQEFEDNCDPGTDRCVMRGGAVPLSNQGELLTCANGEVPKPEWERMNRLDLTGLRCCYPPAE